MHPTYHLILVPLLACMLGIFFGRFQRFLFVDVCSAGFFFALEMNRDHSGVFDFAYKYCILDSFVDYDGYSIFSKGFLPTVVDIMVI